MRKLTNENGSQFGGALVGCSRNRPTAIIASITQWPDSHGRLFSDLGHQIINNYSVIYRIARQFLNTLPYDK